ncbi:MAG: T9SS type A sorting domain-containing protein [Flavobacteriales bacterium]
MLERSVKLYPNPNNGEMINIQLTGITSETVQVNVIDALGRVITTNQYSVNNSFNGTILFDTKLSSGMYNVQIIDGETVMTERVIIK